MNNLQVEFLAKIRLRKSSEAPASWHFITVEKNISQQIKQRADTQPRKGRWSVKVEVRIGFFTRKTSIFPDKTSWCYLLPIKKEVRTALQIGVDDEVLVTMSLL
jgi:hypothetical protein